MRTQAGVLLGALLALAGCGDEPIQVGQPARPAPAAPQAAAEGEGDDTESDPRLDTPSYADDDFVESERNRDPFRSFIDALRPAAGAGAAGVTREVKLRETSIDEMRLIGIITGVADARAMITDREGRGWTVRRGDFIGRPEIVEAGGTNAVQVSINWRVERIRENEVVLARDDPSGPDRPPLTRVIPLRETEDPALR